MLVAPATADSRAASLHVVWQPVHGQSKPELRFRRLAPPLVVLGATEGHQRRLIGTVDSCAPLRRLVGQRELKTPSDDTAYSDVFVEILPTKGEPVELETDLFELIV